MPESDKPLPSLENLQRRIDEAKIASHGQDLPDNAAASGSNETAGLAWSMVSGAGVGMIGGYALDRWLQTSPILLITGFFVGFAVGLYGLIRNVGKNKN